MKTRPASVTIVGWYIIVSGVFALLFMLGMFHNPMMLEFMEEGVIEIPDSISVFFASIIVGIICGGFMLKGHNWSRFLYAAADAGGLLFVGLFFTLGDNEIMPGFPMWIFMIPGFVILFVILFFLFRPRANNYFLKKNLCPDCLGVMDEDIKICPRCAEAPSKKEKKTSALAVASLVFSVLGLLSCLSFMGGILGLIFGYKGRTEVKTSGGALEGTGIAGAGIIISWVAIAKDVIVSVLWLLLISHIGTL